MNSPTASRVLIVDDEPALRATLEKVLLAARFRPVVARDVRHAQELLLLDQADLVISDIKMPDMNGIQFLHWVRANRNRPVILMTGFSEILETKEAARIGADGFLAKPFRREDLLEVIERAMPSAHAETSVESQDGEYCKIAIEDFITGKQIKFDIYIRISESQYVKIAHSGEDLPAARIDRYHEKGIKFLYLRKSDFRVYLSFNLNLADAVVKSPSLEMHKKIHVVRHATEVYLQSAFNHDIAREELAQASAVVENAVSLLCDHEGALDILHSLVTQSEGLFAHGTAVSLYSCLIARSLGWRSHTTMFKLALGGLLHDIGKRELPPELLNRKRSELSPAEIIALDSHPTRGAELLRALGFVPSDVLQIVHEHHENCLGTGYPAHLKKSRIHPLARVVALANDFCGLLASPDLKEPMSLSQVFTRLASLNPEYYDVVAFEGLRQLCLGKTAQAV